MFDQTLQPHDILTPAERSAIAEIEATTSVLHLVTRVTKMSFAATAKFTETDWITCSVYDTGNIGIGLGEATLIETTICSEFKINPQTLLIPQVSRDARFAQRAIVKRFALESYAGVPIYLPDGRMYGALCALDSAAVALDDPDIGEILCMFARLIGCIFYANLCDASALNKHNPN